MKVFLWITFGIVFLNFKEVQLNHVPVYLKFTMFNVTNPDAILKGEKPNLEEVGPYVYEEKRVKTVIAVDEVADTYTYYQNITFHFQEEMSEGHTENDLINIPNGAFITMSSIIFNMLGSSPIGHSLVQGLVGEGETFVKQNVRVGDALFSGYPIPEIYNQAFFIGGMPIPPEFEEMRFGHRRAENGSSDGEYVVRLGATDPSQIGQIKMWDNKTELDWWYPPTWAVPEKPEHTYCNMINGTDGFVFQPSITKDTVLYTFFSDICRSTNYVYEKDIEHAGIPGYQFGFSDNFYDGPDRNPDNLCFCPTPPMNTSSECKGGVQRLFPCNSNAPTVISSPHFLKAFTGYLEDVTGLNPDQEKHETILQVEPNSGMILKHVKRVQVNLELQPLEDYPYFDILNGTILFPVFWTEEKMELNTTHLHTHTV